MIRLILYKWLGLSEPPCLSCEILSRQLEKSESERKDLLNRLMDKGKPEPVVEKTEEHQPITPQFIPWRVRQQMLESEDRKSAQIARDRKKEIAELEAELGVKDAVQK